MKRSEMVLLMYSWMLEPPVEIKQISDGGQQMYMMMNHILSKIEQAGMLPPMLKDESFKLADNGEMIYGVYKWEPEND